jgi:hypothetical protein
MIGLEFHDFSQTLPMVLRPIVSVLDDKLKGSLSGFVGAALLSLYLLLMAAATIMFPDSNWDVLPYIAAAGERTHPTPEALHAYAYESVRAGVSVGDYQALADDGGGYRSHMARDPAAFQSMLPMYRVKFLYIQAASVVLFGAVLLLWLRSAGALALAPLLVAVLIVAEFAYVARSNSPDLLASALLLAGLYAYTRRSEMPVALFLLLAVCVRPDTVIFVGVFAVLVVVFRQRSIGALTGTVASFAAYFVISHAAGHPGWWPHLYFSSVEQQMNMEGFAPAFSVLAYAKALVNAVVRSLVFNTWVGVAVLALGAWYIAGQAGFKLDRRSGLLFAALVLGVLAKFAVFPIHDNRIHFPYLIPPFLLLARAVMPTPSAMGSTTSSGAPSLRS